MDTRELKNISGYLGVSPDKFLQDIGLMKAESKGPSPGTAGNVPLKGFVEYDNYYSYNKNGVKEYFPPVPPEMLRETERKNPVVSACTNLRVRQVRQFSKVADGDDDPGFRIALKEKDRKPNRNEQKEIKQLEEWFLNTGYTDFEGWEDREDQLHDVMVRMVREYMTIDQVAVELRRNAKGDIIDFWMLDAATIRKVMPGGYQGSKNDINPEIAMGSSKTDYVEMITEAKLEQVPEDLSKVRYVQLYESRVVAAYTHDDLIYDCVNKRTDIRFQGMPYPPLEQAIAAVTAFLYALAYNAQQFNQGTIPKIALAFKNGNFSPEQLIELQTEWISNFQGLQGAWRIPMLNGDVQAIDLLKTARDMEHSKYMEFTGALIASVLGVDTAELGLRFQAAQNVMSENVDAKQKFSKDRGLHDVLESIQNFMNKIMRKLGKSDKYKFEFCGITPEDRESASKLRKDKVETYMTVNEIRKLEDLDDIEGGDILLNQAFLQGKQADQQAEQAEQEGYGEEPDYDYGDAAGEAIDESLDDMFKAVDPKKVRSLLK
jgi:hypothetical protein